jgi:pimeloyl-ACP methyl ester carboxylesterase
MPSTGKAAKTILFCAGGPGQFIPTTVEAPFTDFLTQNGYNVVYYHPRGAGFSQISARNTADRYLKTSYVVDDIEAIRHDLIRLGFLGETGKWDAVIGYSFGTVVAQYYVGGRTVPASQIDRLILIGVQSRHSFQGPLDPFDDVTRRILETNRIILENIFRRPLFSSLTTQEKNQIINATFGPNGIFERAEDKFGSISFVVRAYCEIKNELVSNNLNYSRRFFNALRNLRNIGWFPEILLQQAYGWLIATELRGQTPTPQECDQDFSGSSDRVFNVVSIYDGLNMRFLSKWLANGRTNIKDAVRASGGELHYASGTINKHLEKVGISNAEVIAVWDPAQHLHHTPTLILNGSADTVSAGSAADYIFLNALSGPRTLIEYSGVGHLYIMPQLSSNFQPPLPGAACVPGTVADPKPLRDCLLYLFLELSPADFNDPAVNGALASILADCTSISYRDPTMSNTRTLAGTCP